MTKSDMKLPAKTVQIGIAAARRGQQAHVDMVRRPSKLTRAEAAMRDLMLNPPAPDSLEDAKRVFIASQERVRGVAKMYGESATVRSFKLLGTAASVSLGYRTATNLADGYKGIDFAKMFPEPPYAAALKKQIAEMSGTHLVAQTITSQIMPSITASMLAALKVPSVEDMIGRDLLAQLGSVTAAVTASWERQASTLQPIPRPVAPAKTTPVHRREAVRRFLRNLDPALLTMLDGIYDLRDRRNGTGASAYSATEFLKLMVFTLVSHHDVKLYARQTHGTRTEKRHALELIAINYSADASILMSLTNQGDLAGDLQNIKHYGHTMDPSFARRRLLELTDDLESLVVYLSQAIK